MTVDNFYGFERLQNDTSDAVKDAEGYATKFELVYQKFF